MSPKEKRTQASFGGHLKIGSRSTRRDAGGQEDRLHSRPDERFNHQHGSLALEYSGISIELCGPSQSRCRGSQGQYQRV